MTRRPTRLVVKQLCPRTMFDTITDDEPRREELPKAELLPVFMPRGAEHLFPDLIERMLVSEARLGRKVTQVLSEISWNMRFKAAALLLEMSEAIS